jgi:hypothetical protein
MNKSAPMKMLKALRSRVRESLGGASQVDELRALAGKLAVMQMTGLDWPTLREAEFKVFSQFGDDGIIQYLVRRLAPLPDLFVEFGVEDYLESNTRFLLVNDNWRGLVIDGDPANIAAIRRHSMSWRHDLQAVRAFIDCENINQIIEANGFSGSIGLLSIDLDGNDYWVWEATVVVSPVVVIVEYNSLFGHARAVTVPYDPRFDRTVADSSNLFFGCSLRALTDLAVRKGYGFVGCNSNGNNAYFVRNDRIGPLRVLSAEEGFVTSRVRESRDDRGRLTFLAGGAREARIGDNVLWDLDRQALVKVRDL